MTVRDATASGLVAVSRATARTVRAVAGVATAAVRTPAEPEARPDVTAPIPLRGGRVPRRGAPGEVVVGPGTVVGGRYVALDLIARGGMADVFRARDTDGGGLVALKVLRDDDALAAHRLDTELRLLRRYAHRNLVRVHDAGADGTRLFLALELAGGGTLAAVLAAGPLEPPRVAAIGAGLASALCHVHADGVVHRDVTPANVLLDSSGRALLGDFGIARSRDTTAVTGADVITGTIAYVAPELLDGVAPTPASDVYSLGLVLLECLTGRREFTGTPGEVALAKAGRSPAVPAWLPAAWRALLPATTAHDPDRRPTAAEVHRVLARAAPPPAP